MKKNTRSFKQIQSNDNNKKKYNTYTIQQQQKQHNETNSRSRRNSTQDIEVLSRSSDNLVARPFR